MFTGIIETMGEVIDLQKDGTNINFKIQSALGSELKVDQSVAHNGVCLTVTNITETVHSVTAIEETLSKTNLDELKIGDYVNLERCMKADGRFDGHMVYGHVDATGTCIKKENKEGSTLYTFEFDEEFSPLVVEKGSVTLNGTSLTIFDVDNTSFKVAIIPYTFEHTTIQFVQQGSCVNLEFDILGKYVQRLQNLK